LHPFSTFEVKNAEKSLTPDYKGETPRSKHHNAEGGAFVCIILTSNILWSYQDEDERANSNILYRPAVLHIKSTIVVVLDVTVLHIKSTIVVVLDVTVLHIKITIVVVLDVTVLHIKSTIVVVLDVTVLTYLLTPWSRVLLEKLTSLRS
jgi:hypothetical protein